MLGNRSTRKIVIFIVAAVVLGGLVFLWGVSSTDDASISAKDLADLKTRLGKLEARVIALEFSNGDGRASKDLEASLSDLRSRETNVLLRLCDVEEKLGITPQADEAASAPSPAAAPISEAPDEAAPVKQGPAVQMDGDIETPPTVTQDTVSAKTAPATPAPSVSPKPVVSDGSPAVYHQVAAGDTIYNISQRYGLTPDKLRQMNGLDSDTIIPGQRLRVTP